MRDQKQGVLKTCSTSFTSTIPWEFLMNVDHICQGAKINHSYYLPKLRFIGYFRGHKQAFKTIYRDVEEYQVRQSQEPVNLF